MTFTEFDRLPDYSHVDFLNDMVPHLQTQENQRPLYMCFVRNEITAILIIQ